MGGFAVNILGFIVLFLVGLFILYIVVETAVRNGINHSIIGQSLKKKHGMTEDKKSFFDDDLDQDH